MQSILCKKIIIYDDFEEKGTDVSLLNLTEIAIVL